MLVPCVWVAFSPVLKNGFVDWDDQKWIVENYSFRGLGWEQFHFAFTSSVGGVYKPLGWLLQSLTYEFFGLDPHGYHLVSLLFHLANVVILHLLCVSLVARAMPQAQERLGAALGWLCAVPVLFYAVHPLRVEPVAWAICQAYLPGVTFSLLATLAYLRAHPSSGVFNRSWMILTSLLIVLAVLFHGSAVIVPFVFLILDAYPLRRLALDRPLSWPALRTALLDKTPILAFCLAFAALASAAKSSGVDPELTTQHVLIARVAQASFGACFYLAKTVWPFGLTAFYPRPERGDFQTPLFAACFAGVVLAAAAALWQRKKRPWLLAALAAYVVIASPYLGLARVGVTLASDRYSYAPMMAWVVLAGAGLCKLAEHRPSRKVLLATVAGALVAACGLTVLCSAQCRVWDSSEHLWSHALDHANWSPELHHYMGTALAESGKVDRADAELREALRLRPHFFDATYDLGVLLDRRGETDAAIACLREAMELQPADPRASVTLGGVLAHQGHLDEAVATYREALRSHPNDADLHFNLGIALLRQRKDDRAIFELTKATELRPWHADTYDILGGAFALRGDLDEAVVQYRKAVSLAPDSSAFRIDLGLTLARQGRSTEAIAHLREATRRNRQDPETHHVLGTILANLGRLREATAEFNEVLRLRPDDPQARAFLAMAKRSRM